MALKKDPLKKNKDAYELFVNILTGAGRYAMDNKEDKERFLSWLEQNIDMDMNIKSWPDIVSIIEKNNLWCTDNERDMRAFLSVIFNEDLMHEYSEDYESFDELVAFYQ